MSATLLLVLAASPAAAHDGGAEASALAWTFDRWIVLPLAVAGLLYAVGWLRLARRSRRGPGGAVRSGLAWWAGWLTLVTALVSPMHVLAERLFAAHMIEHELVMAVAAPLLVLARPVGMLVWGLPRPARHLARTAMTTNAVRVAWDWLTGATVATIVHGVAIWAWHAPVVFDAAVGDVAFHRLQHLSFLLMAILFWWSMLWRSAPGVAAWHLFLTMLHTSILGALIALAPRVLYPLQTQAAPEWGLTPLEDQQLAGLVMWAPGGIVYAAAALAFVALWIAHSSRGGLNAGRFRSP